MATIHVNRAGNNLGIFSEDDIRAGLRSGRFAGTDLGWREGMPSWQPLSQFSEFSAEISAAASAPPPPPPPPVAGTAARSTITPAIVGSTSDLSGPRAGLPWDDREQRGFFTAFFETVMIVLTRPTEAFTAMRREGGFGGPLIYAVVGGTFGGAAYFLYNFFFNSLGMFGHRENPIAHLIGTGIGSIFFIIFVPVFVALGSFIWAAILHVCLMVVGGAKQSFETTFRVICFAGGSINPLLIIPFCGGFIVCAWKIVLCCIGVARAHETDTGRAVMAVLLPLLICCGGGLILALMFGALGAWGLSQQ
ncbi:MAG: YIP1 family protein [Spartobacteria bacterium]